MSDAPMSDLEFYDLSSGVVIEQRLKTPRTKNEFVAIADQINAEDNSDKKGSVDIAGRNFILVRDVRVANRFMAILNEMK